MFILITVFTVMVLTPLFVVLRNSVSSKERTQAVNLAQKCMELNIDQSKQLGFNNFNSPVSCSVPNKFTVNASVEQDWPQETPDQNYKTIMVEIKKNDASGAELANLKTLRANYR